MKVMLRVGLLLGGLIATGQEGQPFVDYPEKTLKYLERLDQKEKAQALREGKKKGKQEL